MKSYRFARRSFLASVGGAIGLTTMLDNLAAQAEGAKSPARFMLAHFPIGTYRQSYLPTGSQNDFTLSPILAPFQSLLSDMIVLYGLTDNHLRCPGGGGHEAGTPFATTCASAQGTRANGGEGDDGTAGGPSFDQIFLKNVPGLKVGAGFMNTLADARVDSLETSTQCLSYDYQTRSIKAANPAGANITEHQPLLPELSPSKAFATLFSTFMPGGNTPENNEAALRVLRSKKSVLDYSLRELARVKELAPASEGSKIEAHAAAIRDVEMQLQAAIANGGVSQMDCPTPVPPDASLKGQTGSKFNYGNEATSTSDEDVHERIGKAHAAVLLAAFQCDIIRVATFQWSPGTNHVSFKGLYPANPTGSYMHHPMSHRIGDQGFFNGPPLTGTDANASLYRFLVAINTWYNQKMADILTTFKTAKDALGNSILDYTVIPYVTEVGDPSHARSPKASMIFGGKGLGMKGGQFMNFQSNQRKQVDVYLTCAQALLQNADPLSVLPKDEKFDRTGASPINGLWAPPTT
ncbi:MAG: putative conserved secreted protein [Polyangiaceae bacterium]|jgi:hypothetical protein|nr:putative conserved secreted protein [Polyangiaceae bacterium]